MRAALLVLAASLPLTAQQQGGQAPAPPQQRTPVPQPRPTPREVSEPREAPTLSRESVFWGRVMMTGGGPPPAPTSVGMDCGSSGPANIRSTTDGEGNFRIVGSGQIDPRRGGCRVYASLPGYRSSVVGLDAIPGGAYLGVIFLSPKEKVAGLSTSLTSLAAPDAAKRAYNAGLRAAKKRQWTDARRQFDIAVAEYPKYAEAWHELGAALSEQAQPEQAHSAFEKAIEADPKLVTPYIGLANLAARRRDWTDMRAWTAKALELNPLDFPAAYFLCAVAHYNLKQPGEAEENARTFLEMRPRSLLPAGEQLLGRILSEQGKNSEAVVHLRRYLELAPKAPDAAATRERIAALESAAAKGSKAERRD